MLQQASEKQRATLHANTDLRNPHLVFCMGGSVFLEILPNLAATGPRIYIVAFRDIHAVEILNWESKLVDILYSCFRVWIKKISSAGSAWGARTTRIILAKLIPRDNTNRFDSVVQIQLLSSMNISQSC